MNFLQCTVCLLSNNVEFVENVISSNETKTTRPASQKGSGKLLDFDLHGMMIVILDTVLFIGNAM